MNIILAMEGKNKSEGGMNNQGVEGVLVYNAAHVNYDETQLSNLGFLRIALTKLMEGLSFENLSSSLSPRDSFALPASPGSPTSSASPSSPASPSSLDFFGSPRSPSSQLRVEAQPWDMNNHRLVGKNHQISQIKPQPLEEEFIHCIIFLQEKPRKSARIC